MTISDLDNFYGKTPLFTRFVDAIDHARHQKLPENWLVGVTDIVNSTQAISSGRYKAVNMVGASVISAVQNALGGAQFPFVFGGDGATFAVPESLQAEITDVLAAVQVWSMEEVGLELRAALIPMADITAAQEAVGVARLAVTDDVSYAMFSGGGIPWADAQMKAGIYSVDRAAPGTRPDLTGLSCRWNQITAQHGEIMSLLVAREPAADASLFEDLVRKIIKLLEEDTERGGHPVPTSGPPFAIKSESLALEIKAWRGGPPKPVKWIAAALFSVFAWTLFKTKSKFGAFDPTEYAADTSRNTDFRKLDGGLKLTVDCHPDTSARISDMLEGARKAGIVKYGLHCQEHALMTCIVPSALQKDHMHFIDGGEGGYTRAAEMLKAQ